LCGHPTKTVIRPHKNATKARQGETRRARDASHPGARYRRGTASGSENSLSPSLLGGIPASLTLRTPASSVAPSGRYLRRVLHPVERDLLLFGPPHGFVRDGGMEPGTVQRTLDLVDPIALGAERQRDAPRATAGEVDRRRALQFRPFRVLRLQAGGQPADVPPVNRWQRTPHRDRRVVAWARQIELLEPDEAAHDRRVGCFPGPD